MEEARRGPSLVGPPTDGALLDVLTALRAAVSLLEERRRELDALNVFPVPDGDTGANMLATVRAALEAATDAPDAPAPAAVRAALRGARGNSGVLLSQVLRGLLEPVTDDGDPVTDVLDATLPARLARADALARAAVASPVEGTLLTAVRAAAEAADAAAGGGPVVALAAAVAAAHEAVAASTSMLAALARAGVVDAGARGVALVLEALAAQVAGRPPAPPVVHVPVDGPAAVACEVDGGRYEVMYLLEPTDGEAAAAAVRDALTHVGDSVVVVAAEPLVTVHVHTDDIGAAIEVGLDHGRPRQVRVEDLRADAARVRVIADHPAGRQRPGDVGAGALVAGVAGEGLALLAHQLGATVVPLTTGDLPSVATLLDAARRAGHDRIAVLPGHRDVVPTARQAAVLAAAEGQHLDVIAEATSGPAVLAALAVADPTAPVPDELAEAAGLVRAGEVVEAVRAAGTPVGPVVAGDWLAVVAGEVVGRASSAVAAAATLLDVLGPGELVQVLVGAAVQLDDAEAVAALVEQRWPGAEVELVAAGQHPAAFVVGVE